MTNEMEYIYTTYMEGSISKAAKKLFITQPTLSMAIRRVENSLNETLFDRGHQPLKLTFAGELYIQKYLEIKKLERQFTNQIHDFNNLQKGELIIGGTHFIHSFVLAPIMSKFIEQYPNITIRLLECSAGDVENLLVEGEVDFCLSCGTPPHTIKAISHAFLDYVLVAVPKKYILQYNLPDSGYTLDMVCRGEHLQDDNRYTNFLDLAKLPYIMLTPGNNLRERLIGLFAEIDAVANVKMEIEQLATTYYLANSGMGATLASTIMIRNSTCNDLIYYKVNSPLTMRDFYVFVRENSYISRAMVRFIEMIREYYEKNSR